jgi:hypothetical protein
MYRLSQVFVVGKEPTVTYSAREAKQFELTLSDYLEERGRVLAVTGPSKSGKTVLLRKTVPNGLWLAGGQIETVDQFLQRVVDETNSWTSETQQRSSSATATDESGGSLAVKPGGVGGEGSRRRSDATMDGEATSRTLDKGIRSVGLRVLEGLDRPIVIDDFHHMAPDLQRAIIRLLKPLVERELAVILAAVPHHAADAVMAENEMESRVESLQIGLWDEDELVEISTKGFKVALNANISDSLASGLAETSFRSPHLMQLLCRELAKANGLRQTSKEPTVVRAPNNWADFLDRIATGHTDDKIYRDLVRGPQSRKERVDRVLKASGEATDIYGAVMAGIRASGPAEELPYNALRDNLRDLLIELPPKERVTGTLRHMTTIARRHATDEHGRLKRDPVLEWHAERDTVFIADPFFAFRVRFGPQVL